MSETIKIQRGERTYEVYVDRDPSPMNPRTEYDHDATEFFIIAEEDRGNVVVDELTGEAGAALQRFIDTYASTSWQTRNDKIARAFHLWTVLAGSPKVLVSGREVGYSQGDYRSWWALVDTAVMARDGYSQTPEEIAKTEADDYAAYAFGDVYGVELYLDDVELEDFKSWNLFDRSGEFVKQTANDLVHDYEAWLADLAVMEAQQAETHAAELARLANTAGAGFVTVI